MIPLSPILTEDGSRFYRSALRAASNLLLEARQWRNEIERLGPRQVDLSQAEGKLKAAVQSLEISLGPHFLDGIFIDPRDNPNRLDLPGVEQVNIAQELAESRDGTFSAFGFTERSAHEVVHKLGEETLHAVSFLNQKMDQPALDFLFGPASPLRTESRGLGGISAAEASRVKAECLREAEQAWGRAKDRNNEGVTLHDIAFLIEEDDQAAKSSVRCWINSKKIHAEPIGKCPLDGRRQLYRLEELLHDLGKILKLSPREKSKYRQVLKGKLRPPAN